MSPKRILICCEGFIIDGVASYELHLAASLIKRGHTVGFLGRWMGPHGYQERLRRLGVHVLQYVYPQAECGKAVDLARAFAPDVLVSDARRAFPLAMAVRHALGVPIVTDFFDSPTGKAKRGRDLATIERESALWMTYEDWIYEGLRKLEPKIPTRRIRRHISSDLLYPTPLQEKGFHLLCISRFSAYKYMQFVKIARHASELKKAIPDLTIDFVGGGWRQIYLRTAAMQANRVAGERFVRVRGFQIDSQPWFARSSLVCAGATSGYEAMLCGRPVIAFSANWFGLVTSENLEGAKRTYWGERGGEYRFRERDTNAAVEAILDYHARYWKDKSAEAARVEALCRALAVDCDESLAMDDFEEILKTVL